VKQDNVLKLLISLFSNLLGFNFMAVKNDVALDKCAKVIDKFIQQFVGL
jgi:hypothetical protein